MFCRHTKDIMTPLITIFLYLCRVLVLVPTRELGVQVYQVTKQLSQFTSIEVGLSVGGLDLKTQVCFVDSVLIIYLYPLPVN